jgi:digalactosyldiacylglycerol synthase
MVFTVITTSSLPWAAGTTFNPLWRVAELTRRGQRVNLLVPWFPYPMQAQVPSFYTFYPNPSELLDAVRRAIRQRADLSRLKLATYPARWVDTFNSPFPAADVLRLVSAETEVLILEEPEHLFPAGPPPRRASCPTFGILHTNMGAYLRIRRTAAERDLATDWERNVDRVCAAICDRVIALSAAVAGLTNCDVIPVNGVPDVFFAVPQCLSRPSRVLTYGRIEWGKGWDDLIEAAALADVEVVAYGAGPEADEIAEHGRRRGARIEFRPSTTAPWSVMAGHDCFVNPAKTEVLASSSMEALAAGRWLIVPRHPENRLFERFANCLTYGDVSEFATRLIEARAHAPRPDPTASYLSVPAATTRLLDYVASQADEIDANTRCDRPAAALTPRGGG